MKTSAQNWMLHCLDLALLAGVVVLFFPTVGLPNRMSPGGDMVNLFLPGRYWAQQCLGAGFVPLWNPQVFCGVPFHAAMQAAVFYPPNLLLGVVLPPLAVINILRLFHIWLFGAATWWFLRIERALPRAAALLGAVAVAGSAQVAAHTDHVNQLAAMAWLPALAACLWRMRRISRTQPSCPIERLWGAGLVFALLLAMQVLAGHPQAAIYTLLLVALAAVGFVILDFRFWLLDFGRTKPRMDTDLHRVGNSRNLVNWGRFAGMVVLAVVLGFALAGVQVVPTAETAAFSRRTADDLEYCLFGSMPRRGLWTLLWPRALEGEGEGFAGLTTLLLGLAAVGAVGKRLAARPATRHSNLSDLSDSCHQSFTPAATAAAPKRRAPSVAYVFFWLAVVAASWILALGAYGPFMRPGRPSPVYVGFVRLFPPAQHLRVPPRILLLATFGLAVLGAEGLALLSRRHGNGAERSPANLPHVVLSWLAVAALTAELWAFQRGNFHRRVVRYYPPEIALGGDAAASLAPLFPSDLSDISDKKSKTPSLPDGLPDFRIFRLIGRDDPDYLMDSTPEAVRNRWVRLQPNLGMILHVADIEGYEEGLLPPLRYFDFLNFFNRNLRNPDPDAVLLGLMNVRYLYCDAGQPIRSAVWRPAGDVVEPATGRRYRLYENPLWLPRVMWADHLPPGIDLAQLRGDLSRRGRLSERMNTLIDYGRGAPPETAFDALDIPSVRAALPIVIEPHRIVVKNPPARGGRLLVAQNAYPGWIVSVAGKDIPLQPAADFSAMADVPAGAEEFAILYRPFSFRIGAYLSGTALTISIALLFVSVRSVGRLDLRPDSVQSVKSADHYSVSENS
ncbi:MAG: hypothetical protein N3D11_13535 [Candidatus Sumerlaeia bacterium]|nr:hypothetical protein [Candidatus Sumerlaeia bacterium]